MKEPKYKIGDIVKLENGKMRTIIAYSVWPVGVRYISNGFFSASFYEEQIDSLLGHDASVYRI